MTDLYQKYANFAENSIWPAIGVDTDGVIRSWTGSASLLFGWAREEVLGRQCVEVIATPPHQKIFEETLTNYQRDERFQEKQKREGVRLTESVAARRDGTLFPVKFFCGVSNIEGGQIFYIILNDISHEITIRAKRKQVEDSFRQLIDDVMDYGIISLDSTGVIKSWNKGATDIMGYKGYEVLGKPFALLYPKLDREERKSLYALKVTASDGKYEEERWLACEDGSLVWVNVLTTAIHNDRGDLDGFIAIIEDLTKKKQSKEILIKSKEQYRLLLNSIKEYAITMLDPNGNIENWNSAAEKMKGYTSSEVIGKHYSLFSPKEEIAIGKPSKKLELAASLGEFQEEGWCIKKDGSKFWATSVTYPLYNEWGELIGFSEVMQDLSKNHRAEKVKELLQMRDEFLLMTSQKLQAPIAHLKLQLQLGKMNLPSENGDEALLPTANKILDDCTKWVEQFLNTLEGLMETFQAQQARTQLHLENTNFSDIIRNVLGFYAQKLSQANCCVELDIEDKVEGYWDRHTLEQAITQLVFDFLIPFPGKRVKISLKVKEGNALFKVEDLGIEKRRFNLFQDIQQAQRRKDEVPEFSLVKEVAEAHGGTLSFNRGRKGYILVTHLPLEQTAEVGR